MQKAKIEMSIVTYWKEISASFIPEQDCIFIYKVYMLSMYLSIYVWKFWFLPIFHFAIWRHFFAPWCFLRCLILLIPIRNLIMFYVINNDSGSFVLKQSCISKAQYSFEGKNWMIIISCFHMPLHYMMYLCMYITYILGDRICII